MGLLKRALITGISGQDGQYLKRYLVEQGYEVVGISRQGLGSNTSTTFSSHLMDVPQLVEIFSQARPTEVYHLSALSFVPTCETQPALAYAANTLSTLNLLEAIRMTDPSIRFFLASSSSTFGTPSYSPQNELTPLAPGGHYAATKAAAQHLTSCYREGYGIFAVSGILFNHESPLRSPHFLSRKVSLAVAEIVRGQRNRLRLGELDSGRDWGFAGDFVKGMHRMLQQPEPRDFVLGTGEYRTVRQLVETAFSLHGLDWREFVDHDESLKRSELSVRLVADCSLAKEMLGWQPEVGFTELIEMMVQADLDNLS